jgi:hypothetical protein
MAERRRGRGHWFGFYRERWPQDRGSERETIMCGLGQQADASIRSSALLVAALSGRLVVLFLSGPGAGDFL